VTAVLVTGAAGDIGAAIAARLASTGSDVILADHPGFASQLATSAERCRGRGGEVGTTTFDVTDERATDAAVRSLGRIGGLVNGAGLQGDFASIDAYPLDDARRVFDVNVLGLFAVRDALKANAANVVGQLQTQGLKIYLVTGDNSQTAASIAKQVGIATENVFAEVRPEQKAEFVKKLQAAGERVATVSDDQTVRIWRARDGKLLLQLAH
jgi:NAD(P)-dependent dehydrogenase (short-subunit alcohol dehydrogenase family)